MTELGQVLKQTREEKKITLDELQELTKIQKRYLQAIEDGNYSILPGDFYVRAFIKQYADAIGLNHDEVMQNFKHEVPQPFTQDEQQEEKVSRVKKQQDAMPRKSSKVFDYMPQIIIGLIIVGIAVAVWFFWPGNNKNVVQPPQQNNAPEVEKSDESPVNKEEKPQEEKKEE
ncbi:MAG: helix-turn-helix domain-containing protein, partial [Bacillaceae bacterium]